MPLSKKETRQFLERNIEKDPAIATALKELEEAGILLDEEFNKCVESLSKTFDPILAMRIVRYHNSLVEISLAHERSKLPPPPTLPATRNRGTLLGDDKVSSGDGGTHTKSMPGAE